MEADKTGLDASLTSEDRVRRFFKGAFAVGDMNYSELLKTEDIYWVRPRMLCYAMRKTFEGRRYVGISG
jgi:hypothetical protein